MPRKLFLLLSLTSVRMLAQQDPPPAPILTQILERLNALEKENKQLSDDVHALRQELATTHAAQPPVAPVQPRAADAPVDERLTVEEHRTAEQAQTKVEAAHKLPIQLTGAVLFNAFTNTRTTVPSVAGDYNLLTGPARDGATFRQTQLGFTFEGPALPGNGRLDGFLSMDFFAGSPAPNYQWLRLRRAGVHLAWRRRSFFVGQDKPLISPYQPDSLAEVGVPPLAGAGNLWLWLPQVRYEERIPLSASTTLKAQVAAIETDENYTAVPSSLVSSLQPARPALEGRLEFSYQLDETRRFALAPGFHLSTTHVAGTSVSSHIASLDWSLVPFTRLQLSGAVFTGQNVASLGALGNGVALNPSGSLRAVQASGGWTQLAIPLTNRLTWNLFSGLEDDRAAFLPAGAPSRDWTYASNLMYHLGSNVLVSAEALQARSQLASGASLIQNHFDLALAYLF